MPFVVVRNPLVEHVWRLMPGWNVYRNWYLGQGAFVQNNPDVRRWVRAYMNETDPAVAMGNLFSATERLLRSALKVEGVDDELWNEMTLPSLLKFCVGAERGFFNLVSMCCDIRAVYRLNAIRVGMEHGNYARDQRELAQGGWKPQNPDEAYQEIIAQRLLSAHSQVCGIFNQVEPDTGRFLKNWKLRGFAQCETKGHDANGRTPDDEPEPATPVTGQ